MNAAKHSRAAKVKNVYVRRKRKGRERMILLLWGGAVCTQLTGAFLHACSLMQIDKADATR
jgi:hypothetical protein